MSDETPRKPRDWSRIEVPSIPADDPIYTEGVIITFPIRPRPAEKADDEKKSPDPLAARLGAGSTGRVENLLRRQPQS